MHDYSTIFFAVCQDRNGFLFRFVNFAQTQVIFYSKLTSKNIPFFFFALYVQLFSIEIIAEKAVLHLVTHHLYKRRSRIVALYTKKPPRIPPHERVRILGDFRLSGLLLFLCVFFFCEEQFNVFLCLYQLLHFFSCLAIVRVIGFLLGQ